MAEIRPPASCEGCRRPLTLHESVRGTVCGDPECRRRAVVRMEAERKAAAAARRRRAVAFGEDFARHRGIEGAVLVAAVQWNPAEIAPLPPVRRERFRRHLVQILRILRLPEPGASGAPPPEDPSPGTEEARALTTACATCRGYCCRTGGDTAWLDQENLARIRASRPDLRRKEILDLYLSCIPQHSLEEACVLAGDTGCRLPRSLRSATCNQYQCDDLLRLRAQLGEEERGSPVFVATDKGWPVRAREHRPHPKGMLSGEPPREAQE